MGVSGYLRGGDLHYDGVRDELVYRRQHVPDSIRRHAESMSRNGAPHAIVEEYVAEMMRAERQKADLALNRLAKEYPHLMCDPVPPPPTQPTHRKEILCLL